jgi:hypothetical protein
MSAPYTQGNPAHIAKGRSEAIACAAFIGLAGRGATAPGAVVIRPGNELHPFMVHFLNTQDGAYYFGDYCTTKDEAYRAMDDKLRRYDRNGDLRLMFEDGR